MNVMRAIDSGPDAPQYIDDFEAANRALENLKGSLANHGCYEQALDVSEMLRDLDRTRRQYVHRDDIL
jgi:hypothetical protein